jgi:invasion protein IalB
MTPRHSLASALAIAVALGGPAIAQQFAPEEGEAPAIGAFPETPGEQAEPEPGTGAAPEAAAPETEDGADEDAPAAPEAAAEPPAADDEAPAAADEAPAAADEAPAAADEVPPAAGEEAVAPGPQLPTPEVYEIVRETFQDWEVRCAPDGDDCFVYQLALDEDENPVAEFSLVRLPAGSEAVAGATVVTPLGTLLPAGLVMQVNDGEARQYPFTFCSQVGCFAQLALTQETISSLQRGRVARLTLASVAAPSEPVELELSLMGFTAAYNSIQPGE